MTVDHDHTIALAGIGALLSYHAVSLIFRAVKQAEARMAAKSTPLFALGANLSFHCQEIHDYYILVSTLQRSGDRMITGHLARAANWYSGK
jgi:hypothetical protein